MAGSIKFLRSRRGARIAYTAVGSPPLTFLPPWATHLEALPLFSGFRAFEESIAKDHSLIAYDRWGTGLSDRGRDDFSIEADLEVLADVADHLHLRRFALFAPSHGGPLGIEFALRYPQRVSHLVLYATLARGLFHKEAWESFRQFILADWDLAARASAAMMVQGGAPSDLEAFVRLMKMSSSPEMLVALQDGYLLREETPPLGELRVPTLVLQRRGDPLISVEEARELASQIPGARLELLDGEAHVNLVGDSAAVAQRICAFTAGGRRVPSAQLSAREAEVLDLVAEGYTNTEVAERLVLSIRTVERHLLNAYAKLGARGRTEAISRWLTRRDEAASPSA